MIEKQIAFTELTTAQVWDDISIDLNNAASDENICLTIVEHERRILLESDPQKALISLSSIMYNRSDYQFSIHSQDIIDEVSKFFGGQDVILGYPGFDKKFIVKTNQAQRTEDLFADAGVRAVFESLPRLRFGIVQYLTETEDGKIPFLQLQIEERINEAQVLEQVYTAFKTLLLKVDI